MKDWLKYVPGLMLMLSGLWGLNSSMQKQYDQIKQVVDLISLIDLPKSENPAAPDEPEVVPETPVVVPESASQAPKPKAVGPTKKLVMNSPHISWFQCPACERDKAQKIPNWAAAGYNVVIREHTSRDTNVDAFGRKWSMWPWYEMYDAQGNYSAFQVLPPLPSK